MANPKRILVIDNEVGLSKTCATALEKCGYVVDCQIDFEAAAFASKVTSYDVIVADLNMPVVEELGRIEKMKSSPWSPAVVLMTSHANIRNAVEAIKRGASDYLAKPFTSEELLGAVSRALALKEMHLEKPDSCRERQHTEEGCAVSFPRPPEILRDSAVSAAGDKWWIGRHSWAHVESESAVLVGFDGEYLRSISAAKVEKVEILAPGTEVAQGEACAELTISSVHDGLPVQTTVNVWLPVGGVVVETNETVLKAPDILRFDPFEEGWLLRIRPAQLETDLANLSWRDVPFR